MIIPLTNFETSFEIMEVRGTSTITFFITKDIECAFKSIQERFVQIAEFNPWMVGSLESTGIRLNVQPKVVHLSHPPLSDKAEFDAALAKACPAEPLVRDDNGESVKVHPQMSFDDIVETVSLAGGRLDKGSALVDDATKVVSKWTCLSGLDDKSFALIFTMSHVVADGFTYYSILSMLSTDSEVYSLDFTRNADARSRCLQLCGQVLAVRRLFLSHRTHPQHLILAARCLSLTTPGRNQVHDFGASAHQLVASHRLLASRKMLCYIC